MTTDNLITVAIEDGISEFEIGRIQSAIAMIRGVSGVLERWPLFHKDGIVFMCMDRDDVETAMRMCCAWADGRNAKWIALPYGSRPSDPMMQRGYVGLKLGGKNKPETEVERVRATMLGEMANKELTGFP
jgi:hypothetical protein